MTRGNDSLRDRNLTRDHYEAAWNDHDRLEVKREGLMRREANEDAIASVLAAAAQTGKGLILEIGPGLGEATRRFATAGHRVMAVDIARSALTSLNDSCIPSQGELERLPFQRNIFSVVFVNSVLMFCDLATALREIHRVLAPGGLMVILEPMAGNPFLSLYRHLHRGYKGMAVWHGYDAIFETARRLFGQVAATPYHLIAPLTLLPPPLRYLLALDRPFARFFPGAAWLLRLEARKI